MLLHSFGPNTSTLATIGFQDGKEKRGREEKTIFIDQGVMQRLGLWTASYTDFMDFYSSL